MNYWHLWFQLMLPLLFAPQPWAKTAKNPYLFDLEETNLTVRGHKQVITVTWNIPNKTMPPHCYKSEVEYKNQCVQDWRRLEVNTEYDQMIECNFTHLSMKQNYDFRLRLKVDCLDGDWSKWTRVQSWGNNKGVCKDSSSSLWIYILIVVLPMTALLVIFLMMQEGIRKLILPEVPDPKNYKHKIMDIDQSQWWSSLGQGSEECKTTEIEIVSQSENCEDDHTVIIQSTDTMYCTHASETSGESSEAQGCQMPVGYITL